MRAFGRHRTPSDQQYDVPAEAAWRGREDAARNVSESHCPRSFVQQLPGDRGKCNCLSEQPKTLAETFDLGCADRMHRSGGSVNTTKVDDRAEAKQRALDVGACREQPRREEISASKHSTMPLCGYRGDSCCPDQPIRRMYSSHPAYADGIDRFGTSKVLTKSRSLQPRDLKLSRTEDEKIDYMIHPRSAPGSSPAPKSTISAPPHPRSSCLWAAATAAR